MKDREPTFPSDHVVVILRATDFDRLIQADSSSNIDLSDIRTWMITSDGDVGSDLPSGSG